EKNRREAHQALRKTSRLPRRPSRRPVQVGALSVLSFTECMIIGFGDVQTVKLRSSFSIRLIFVQPITLPPIASTRASLRRLRTRSATRPEFPPAYSICLVSSVLLPARHLNVAAVRLSARSPFS